MTTCTYNASLCDSCRFVRVNIPSSLAVYLKLYVWCELDVAKTCIKNTFNIIHSVTISCATCLSVWWFTPITVAANRSSLIPMFLLMSIMLWNVTKLHVFKCYPNDSLAMTYWASAAFQEASLDTAIVRDTVIFMFAMNNLQRFCMFFYGLWWYRFGSVVIICWYRYTLFVYMVCVVGTSSNPSRADMIVFLWWFIFIICFHNILFVFVDG